MYLNKLNAFLSTVDLEGYRKRYGVRIMEMDMDKEVQAIALMYDVYWNEKKLLSFKDFFERYLKEKFGALERFRKKTTLCKDCFYRGLEARIYRTWAGLITQIQGGYVAESVFGKGAVKMSEALDRMGADIRVEYKGRILNYQIKKTSFSGVKSARHLPRKKAEGESVDIFYEVPSSGIFVNPKKLNGEPRLPYERFMEDKRTERLSNGFIIFTEEAFLPKKREIDSSLR